MSTSTGWTTARELAFIDHLGRYSVHGSAVGRRALLQGYVQSLPQRWRWGDLDRIHVTQYAHTALLEAALTEELTHA